MRQKVFELRACSRFFVEERLGHERELTVDGDGERSVQYLGGLLVCLNAAEGFFNDQKENVIAIFGPVVVDGDLEFVCLPADVDVSGKRIELLS